MLAVRDYCTHVYFMFWVSKSEATMIRTAYDQGGELLAAVELRRLFPGIKNHDDARRCALMIAGWTPLPATPP